LPPPALQRVAASALRLFGFPCCSVGFVVGFSVTGESRSDGATSTYLCTPRSGAELGVGFRGVHRDPANDADLFCRKVHLSLAVPGRCSEAPSACGGYRGVRRLCAGVLAIPTPNPTALRSYGMDRPDTRHRPITDRELEVGKRCSRWAPPIRASAKA
jgi:hypothetical protein